MKKFILLLLALTLVGCKPGPVHLSDGLGSHFLGGQTASSQTYAKKQKRLDDASKEQLRMALLNALQTGKTTTWRSANASGTITPTRAYRQGGRICREFISRIVTVDGQMWKTHDIACPQRNGWRIQ